MVKTRRQEHDPRFSERDNPEAKIWDRRPDERSIQDLKQHVIQTGKPDEWKWHCHSTPPIGSRMPELIAEDIDIPERLRSVVGAAPCPLCSLRGPKYFHGMLVFYRQEKALRVIGRECGRNFYGDGFEAEIKASRLRRADDSALGFLIDNLGTVRDLRRSITLLLPRARHFDMLRSKVIDTITKKSC
ncbi:hypothetical protein RZS28_05645 [Methylocapsa polymorpha]|uniref:Uncharacterized protein n=1 Tax=Methylocapsa polymorpha TaxID=3080828 RepID=A0ABZ0HVH7_9HYPH|nr:hypothetical protein RZS28_05645 [Methylocapsa sp. RX1]